MENVVPLERFMVFVILLWYLLDHLAECNGVNAFTAILEKKDNMQV
jgi:hypothetical protein